MQVHLNPSIIEELTFFAKENTEVYTQNEDIFKKPSLAFLCKRSSENLPTTTDNVIAQMIYGNLRQPPGDEKCPYQKLLLKKAEKEIAGVWTAANSSCKAMALKWLFPTISGPYKLPEYKPVPPHLIVAYDAFKYREVMELKDKYPGTVMKYGFFTKDTPGQHELITKTVEKFESKTTPPTYEEKIVIQLAKQEESFTEFLNLGPSYISSDTVQGEEEAKLFFPQSYEIPEDIILEIKKKPKKKGKGKFVTAVETHEEQILQMDKGTNVETVDERSEEQVVDTEKDTEAEGEDDDFEIERDADDECEVNDETDKATSPMTDTKMEEAVED